MRHSLQGGSVFRQSRGVNVQNKAKLYARRREMYRLHIQKLNMTDILDKLSAKYSVSKKALWLDWQKRSHWVYDVFDLEPGARTMS